MSVPVVAFFNNKGGVGKTSLVYHIAWMMADQGRCVVAVDLDPQGNLSAAFLDEERLEELWPEDAKSGTVYAAIRPLKRGVGDVETPHIENIVEGLSLVPGDMGLSEFEDDLSQMWPKCLDGDERAFRVLTAFWRVLQRAAAVQEAEVVLIDLGPNLGAINRAALVAADCVVVPLGPDLFSLQGLRNLGPALRRWRSEWKERVPKKPPAAKELELPRGEMQAIGYIVMQHSVRKDRPIRSYDKWIARIPGAYRRYVLQNEPADAITVTQDQHCFALLKHYRSLMPMAQEARKPMFHLKPADGALGAHTSAVRDAYGDFKALAAAIAERAGLLPA